MRKLYIALLLLAVFTSSGLFAQDKTKTVKTTAEIYKEKADIEFELIKYRSASSFYLLSDTTSLEVIQKLAKSLYEIKEYKKAEYWYKKEAAFPNLPDQFYLDYGDILANNGKYELSAANYKKYSDKHPSDRRAKNLARTALSLKALQRDSLNWTLSYPSFNTNKDEFSPVYFNNGLIFTSNRDKTWGVKGMFGWNQTPFTDLYIVEDVSKVKYLKPANYFNDTTLNVKLTRAKKQGLPVSINDTKILGDPSYPKDLSNLNLEKDSTPVHILRARLNSRYHDGPMSLTPDQFNMFYNQNQLKTSKEGKDKVGIFKLNMFSGNYVGGQFYNRQAFPYNSLEYSTAHPALTPDGNILYFVSDMPGGYGGKDIYYCVKEGSTWGKPVNAGPEINTEGDETFPYVAYDGTFYFSSNGHTGLGGLDIFSVEMKNNKPVSPVRNMCYPANSSKDDFGIIMDDKNATGYFSSNRYGSDDIFKFDYVAIPVDLKGKITTTYEYGGKTGVTKALVTLTYDNQTDTTYTNNVGDYAFKKLSLNTDYAIKAQKSGYDAPANGTFTTVGIKGKTTIVKDFELTKPMILAAAPAPAVVSDCEMIKSIYKSENVYYDLDKFKIRPDAATTLDKLVDLMKKFPALTVTVKSHTDSRASQAYNEKLSNNRSNAAISYLVSHGISRARISSEYFGERKLVNGCADGVDCSEADQQLNRRSEFYLFLNGKNLTIDCGL